MATSKRKVNPALKAGPKNLSKLPKGLRDYWANKRKQAAGTKKSK